MVKSYTLRFNFPISNNMAKLEALINGMQLVLETRVNDLKVLCDSRLVVNQIKGIYEARDETMKWYLAQVRAI